MRHRNITETTNLNRQETAGAGRVCELVGRDELLPAMHPDRENAKDALGADDGEEIAEPGAVDRRGEQQPSLRDMPESPFDEARNVVDMCRRFEDRGGQAIHRRPGQSVTRFVRAHSRAEGR